MIFLQHITTPWFFIVRVKQYIVRLSLSLTVFSTWLYISHKTLAVFHNQLTSLNNLEKKVRFFTFYQMFDLQNTSYNTYVFLEIQQKIDWIEFYAVSAVFQPCNDEQLK